MSIALTPYLGFRDNAREALEFYHSVLGGELTLTTFADGGMEVGEGEGAKIMHGQLTATNGLMLMGADTPSSMRLADESNITVSLSGDDEATLTGYWERLSEGATVLDPLRQAPWGDQFGMLRDRFGTAWLVNISANRADDQG
ncbi:VOC family protein [Curtobacterium ammoniigenes]|uniref:VOC family protein n=1 Tax=Curtobacterium ammoniigenes TaxID=395387 RepID=UPI00082EFD12|nr:VOC family protein [Curtobacterium ammoniigenes]